MQRSQSDNTVKTTSLKVAEAFEKKHADVLRKIDEICTQVSDIFKKRNFAPLEVEQKTNLGNGTYKTRAYELTKDGFMLLVMGFTGKKAMQTKIAFIDAFNWMAEQILKTKGRELPSPYVTDEQLVHIKQGVREMVYRTGKHWQAVYHELFAYVQAPSVREIKCERYADACHFLGISEKTRGLQEKHLVPVDALPPAHIVNLPIDTRKNTRFLIEVKDGLVGRYYPQYATSAEDFRQPWGTLLKARWEAD